MMDRGFTTVAVASIFLTGCLGGNPVKDTPFYADGTYKFGQVIENRSICRDYSWDSFEDEKGRSIIEYSCEYYGAEEYFSSVRDRYSIALQDKDKKNEIIYLRSIAHYEETLEKLNQVISDVVSMYKNGTISEQDEYFRTLHTGSSCFQFSYSENKHEESIDCLYRYQSKLESDIEEAKNSVEVDRERSLEIVNGYNYDSVTEIIQWAIIDNSDPSLVFRGYRIKGKSGAVERQPHNESRFFQVMLNDNVDNVSDYVEICKCVNFASLRIGFVNY